MTDHCGRQKRDGSGEACQLPAGWGTDHPGEGACKHHGGASTGGEGGAREGAGAPEANANAVSHGLYATTNTFYQQLDDDLRALCDEIFQDYCTAYRERYGDVSTKDQARLFEIAVNHTKIIYSDNWLVERPDDLDSGNPMVEQETKYTDEGRPYHEYKESVVTKLQQRLRREDRAWLRDLGLLNDPETDQAGAVDNLAAAIREVTNEHDR